MFLPFGVSFFLRLPRVCVLGCSFFRVCVGFSGLGVFFGEISCILSVFEGLFVWSFVSLLRRRTVFVYRVLSFRICIDLVELFGEISCVFLWVIEDFGF